MNTTGAIRRAQAVRQQLALVADRLGVALTPSIPSTDPTAPIILALEDLATLIEQLAGEQPTTNATKARKSA